LANEEFLKVLRINPEYADGYFEMAQVLLANYKLKQGDVYYQKASNINPSKFPMEDLYVMLGALYQGNLGYDWSITFFKKALELKPNYAFSYVMMAKSYKYLSEFENKSLNEQSANDAFQKAIEICRNLGDEENVKNIESYMLPGFESVSMGKEE